MDPVTPIAGAHLPDPSKPDAFDTLAQRSRSLHGHMYVLPVAAWILQAEKQTVTAADAMAGLAGRADRIRVLEALKRLAGIEALRELPRLDRKNATRCFELLDSPYWELVEAYANEVRHAARAAV
jgi:hypothetical protein